MSVKVAPSLHISSQVAALSSCLAPTSIGRVSMQTKWPVELCAESHLSLPTGVGSTGRHRSTRIATVAVESANGKRRIDFDFDAPRPSHAFFALPPMRIARFAPNMARSLLYLVQCYHSPYECFCKWKLYIEVRILVASRYLCLFGK